MSSETQSFGAACPTSLDTRRGFLLGVPYHKLEFTTYIFNLGWTSPTAVLELGVTF